MSEINFLEEISNFTFTSKYARYRDDLKRRETWEESVDRVLKMHLKKYSFLNDEYKEKIKYAFSLVKEKRVVPSMRSLQYGGLAIEEKNPRMFNCAVRHVDSIRSFSEIFYLLLCGCGVGIGLHKNLLNRLPDLVGPNDKSGSVITYQVLDTIEGWADSIEALLSCYFKNTAFSGRKIVFDYSRIRPKGAPLKIGGGKAPGYKGLKNSHEKIKRLLDHVIESRYQTRLRSIDVYDILMFCSDAVLSGGCRRSATSAIFGLDDNDMINAKTYIEVDKVFIFHKDGEKKIGGKTIQLYEGKVLLEGQKYEIVIEEWELEELKKNKVNWWHIHPQRARSNNSVLLLRNKITEKEFSEIFNRTKQFGEPGFVFANDDRMLFNPCQPAWAPILTKNGISKMGDIKVGDEIWSETGWTKVVKKWSTGIKKVYKYTTTAGSFYGTENHQLVSNGVKIEAKDCDSVDILSGFYNSDIILDIQDIMDGLVIGDGSAHSASNGLVHLYIGENDRDYFNSEISTLIVKHRPGISDFAHEIKTTITPDELPKTFLRDIPDRFYYGSPSKVCGFLRGLFSANGSICDSRVTLKATSKKVIEKAQSMLSSVGIKSYITFNKSKNIKFSNGEYLCKDSYDLNITRDREKFNKIIGFIQLYKQEKLNNIISNIGKSVRTPKVSYDIISTELISEEEVFDITVDNHTHTYWTNGLNVSNCFEISFIPITDDGVCGVQFCNLTSINGRLCDSEEKFYECCEASAIIGTLQAGYTNFPYLSKAAETLTREESLLGCSITGFMDNPDILLSPSIQSKGSEICKNTNLYWSSLIKINPAARVTCVKPEGTSSLVLQSGSGIHAHHARKYFRRIQCNKNDNIYKFFKKHNPHMCEPSVWSANHTDDVVCFPLQINEKCLIKSDLTSIKHLELIKSTQKNWVVNGTNEFHNNKNITHNTSCTVICKDNEWDDVCHYLYTNRDFFSAVSLLPESGDKLYPQAPNEKIENENDVSIWNNIIKNYKKVNYSELIESDDQTSLHQEIACAGGNCEK